ncbi:hypothetical protein [Porphyrobacter sp. CACIAM 03H1]|uniref:hypothetical protein n=1 Tax=Porphyrobacter sp. CACIAM 03H1 TaxID=2003315 RepID=UPI0012FDEF99|nr:hypothetical protein [Porphyrobacter sp. CACIAM 03H1]
MPPDIAFFDCADELFSIETEIENCAHLNICCSGPGNPLSPPLGLPGLPTTTKQGTRTMRMISEKAVAFLLAVVVSGTAFNTFIV